MSSDNRAPRLRVAVIGAGITGLAAAHRIVEMMQHAESLGAVELSVFEAADQVGGVAATIKQDGYLIETGPDSFITNKPAAIRLCERLGFQDELISTETEHRGSLVLRKGKPERVPEGFMLLSPAKVWPVLKSPIFSWGGKLRMAYELFVGRSKESEDESLASFVRRRFGNEVLERLVQPLVGGIYTSDPERLSLKATLPRFLDMEKQHRSLILGSRKQAADAESQDEFQGSGARYGLFATFRNGLSSLFERLVERVSAVATIRLGTRIVAVCENASSEFELTMSTASGDTGREHFDRVLVALPAYAAAKILQPISERHPDFLNALNCLDKIEYASTAIVASGYRLDHIRHAMDAFGLVVPAIEKRSILAASFTSRKFAGRAPDGSVLIRTFVGGAMQPELLENSDEVLRSIVHSELAEIFGIDSPPQFSNVYRHDRAMPQYYLGHLDRVQTINEAASHVPNIELAGNAFEGVGLPDCIHSGERAAERLLGN
jgi:oxygen-dependent protoporphyrinogen oxidase